MNNFDWEGFIDNKVAVYCKTEEEADNFVKTAMIKGFKWCYTNRKRAMFYMSGGTCYSFGYIHYTEPYEVFLIGIKQDALEHYKNAKY